MSTEQILGRRVEELETALGKCQRKLEQQICGFKIRDQAADRVIANKSEEILARDETISKLKRTIMHHERHNVEAAKRIDGLSAELRELRAQTSPSILQERIERQSKTIATMRAELQKVGKIRKEGETPVENAMALIEARERRRREERHARAQEVCSGSDSRFDLSMRIAKLEQRCTDLAAAEGQAVRQLMEFIDEHGEPRA